MPPKSKVATVDYLKRHFDKDVNLNNIYLSVDKVLDIAKTISTVTVALSAGTTATRTMLMTDEERTLSPLLPSQF